MLARAVGEQAFGVPARQPQLEQPLGGNEGKDRDRPSSSQLQQQPGAGEFSGSGAFEQVFGGL